MAQIHLWLKSLEKKALHESEWAKPEKNSVGPRMEERFRRVVGLYNHIAAKESLVHRK